VKSRLVRGRACLKTILTAQVDHPKSTVRSDFEIRSEFETALGEEAR